MSQATKIEWCDVSWNPVHGCSRVSTGCKHCYAETLSLRYGQTTAPWTQRNAVQNVLFKPHKLREPLSKAGPWKNPCRVFVNSMSDLFHEEIPDEYIARVFVVMALARQHTFQILTKRPDRMRNLLRRTEFLESVESWMDEPELPVPWPLPNVWLGVSIENRKWVGRADVLRQTPAAVRFISAEPLLGPLDDTHHLKCMDCGWLLPSLHTDRRERCPECDGLMLGAGERGLDLAGIDWLIVGGESGTGHRPMDAAWARDLRDAADDADVAFFMKQLGGSRPGTALEDLPEDLRIREFPR